MPKPVCTKCLCFFRPKTNSFAFVEGMPNGTADPDANIRGRRAPEAWQPYKIWIADAWQCPDCGVEIVVGAGPRPLAEHYEPEFERLRMQVGATLQINDC